MEQGGKGPTWVREEPFIVESVRAPLPVGLRGQGAESIDSERCQELPKQKRAGAALRGVGCRWWRRWQSQVAASLGLRVLPHHKPHLSSVPEVGSSGMETRLKAQHTASVLPLRPLGLALVLGPLPAGPPAAAEPLGGKRGGCEWLSGGQLPQLLTPAWPIASPLRPPGTGHLLLWCTLHRPQEAVVPNGRRLAGPPSATFNAGLAPCPYLPA